MMKRLVFLVAMLMLCVPVSAEEDHSKHEVPVFKNPVRETGEKSKLQKMIDATEPGGVLELEGRVYRGTMVINKPITIKGVDGTEINSLATAFIISDTTDVYLEGFSMQTESVAFAIENVDNITLKNIYIHDSASGIQMMNTTNMTMDNVDIQGKPGHFSTKGHAMAIYESKHLTLTESDIDNMLDGIYLENVDNVEMTHNRVSNGRYAMHMMYSDNIEMTHNTLTSNMTGFMVMVAENVLIEKNIVEKNNSLNSLAVYTYDLQQLQFRENELRENTTAMDIQNVEDMVVENNLFSTNGTVLQVKRSGTLVVTNNEFHGNILTLRSDKEGVDLRHNFYDDYDGKDYNGDGIGDTSYIATNSFGQWMVRKPVYQYFIESPSVVTLNMMDTEVTDGNKLVVTDVEPVIEKKDIDLSLNIKYMQLVISVLIIGGLLFVWRKLA